MTFSFKISPINKPKKNYETRSWRLDELKLTKEHLAPDYIRSNDIFDQTIPNIPYLPPYIPTYYSNNARANVRIPQEYYHLQPYCVYYQNSGIRNNDLYFPNY